MIIEPKVKGFICTTAHPEGCAESVRRQIAITRAHGMTDGPKKVLVIGCSTGYGLASRITTAFGCGAATLGVMFEKPATARRSATPGFYNTRAFEEQARAEGFYAKTINGDAFSSEVKEEVFRTIRQDLGQIDCVIYSLAAPRRTAPDGVTYTSALKTCQGNFTEKSWNLTHNTVETATIGPATEEEIQATIKVMGGEDWILWIRALYEAGLMAPKAFTLAYSYIGPALTYPVYHEGTIGLAKKHLYESSLLLNREFAKQGLTARISVNKALVTQASSAIPIVPLYFALLYQVMKEQNLHEGCIEQMNRLFFEKLPAGSQALDEMGRIRLDDWEMLPQIQQEVTRRWKNISTDNLFELADIDGYWEDFYHMFGFHFDTVDYTRDVCL